MTFLCKLNKLLFFKKLRLISFFTGNIPLRSNHAELPVGAHTHQVLAPSESSQYQDALFQPFTWLVSAVLQVQLKRHLLQEALMNTPPTHRDW